MNSMKIRLWFEIGSAAVCLVLFVVTMISSEWIEFVFGVDPDHGDGSLERWIMVGTALVALVAILLARADWRRLRSFKRSV